MAEININNEKKINVSLSKAKTINTNITNLSYIPAYAEYEKQRQENEAERQAYYEDFKTRVENGEFKGNKLEYDWKDTELGVRVEGDTEYEYVDLQGEQGESGVYIGAEEPTNGANVWINPEEGTTEEYVTKAYLEEMLGVIENGSY